MLIDLQQTDIKPSQFISEPISETKCQDLEHLKEEIILTPQQIVDQKRDEWKRLKKEAMKEHRMLNKPPDQRYNKSKLNLVKAREVRLQNIKERHEREESEKKELRNFLNASDDSSSDDDIIKGGKYEKKKQRILEIESKKEIAEELKQLKEMIFLQNKRNLKLKDQINILAPRRRHYNSSDDDHPRRKDRDREPVIINIHEKQKEDKIEPKINSHELNKLKSHFK